MTNFTTEIANGQALVNTQPTLPDPAPDEIIRLELLELAKSAPSDLLADQRLRETSKKHKTGLKIIRLNYAAIVAECRRQEDESQEPTAEELAAQSEAQEAEHKLRQQKSEWEKKVEDRANQVASSPNIFMEFHEALKRCCNYVASADLAATVAITHGSRLLPQSTGYIFHGASASGKSALIEKGAQFLPPESVARYTSYSNQALNYIGSLEHKYILGGELKTFRPGDDDAFQQSFRQLISENRIGRVVVEQGPDGKFETREKVTRGPATFVMTTTRSQTSFNDEFVNRQSWCATSEDADTTSKVLTVQAATAESLPDESEELKFELEVQGWQKFHRDLKPDKVVIPFARNIQPTSRDVTARRLFPLLLNYVKVSCLLHQRTRETTNTGPRRFLVANRFDYEIAYRLIVANAPRSLDLVNEKGREVFGKIKEEFGVGDKAVEFSRAKVQTLLKLDKSAAKRFLADLKDAGCLAVVGKDNLAFVYKVVSELPPKQDLGLIKPEDAFDSSAQIGSEPSEPTKGNTDEP
jgi:hypothetical protein